MANQQAFQAYPQNKGTLTPGQTISVNKQTVQVERYLSQGKWSSRPIYPTKRLILFFSGGFAHVYLVRTPTPVYNTTHHVLKRIQVPDESMLTEVRKEVDVMVRS
jgi:AP2-associated kinase